MLEHLQAQPVKPSRVVIIGAGGFVGGAIRKRLEAEQVTTLPLTRRELDLLQDNAAQKLQTMLRPDDK